MKLLLKCKIVIGKHVTSIVEYKRSGKKNYLRLKYVGLKKIGLKCNGPSKLK